MPCRDPLVQVACGGVSDALQARKSRANRKETNAPDHIPEIDYTARHGPNALSRSLS
ncbi:protein of unknown function (plasmid) [Pararobbsia alpina]